MIIEEQKMTWNEENVTRLRELWDQGLPTAQIGKLIGFTKNAVVGTQTQGFIFQIQAFAECNSDL